MSDQYIGEIRIFGGNFAILDWAFCQGQLLPISRYTALFSLLGTTYGGNGTTTFALPNLQGCAPMQAGQGQGLSLRDLGETGGEPSVTLLTNQIPPHAHGILGASSGKSGQAPSPAATTCLGSGVVGDKIYGPATTTPMSQVGLTPAGGSLPHNNMQPYLVLNYIIALNGVFPPRS
jgi:microcystin-dependent protein